MSIEQIRAEVRFALNQMSIRNGQYEFETMTRMLARATVTRNLLPATGPVSAGGDQGRDFESHPTQLPGQVQALGRELGVPDKALVGFACTLQKEGLRGKVKRDVAKIMAGDSPVDFIVAYCEADIPVAQRHAMEREARERHHVRLVVFDGNAITERLVEHATFWIAETYLHVPARVLPPPAGRPDWYEQDLARWQADHEPLDTMGRVIDVAGCLHYACTTHDGRPDVPFWLEKLEAATGDEYPPTLRRRGQYELVIGNIRGLGSLRPVDQQAVDYLTGSLSSTDTSDLEDATLMLSYVCAAFARGETALTADDLRQFNNSLQAQVKELLEGNPTPGRRCQLLDTLATLKLQPDAVAAEAAGAPYRAHDDLTSSTFDERMAAIEAGELRPMSVPLVDAAGAIDAWRELGQTLPDAPLFPVDTLSRLLTLYTPTLIDEPGFDEVTVAIDLRVATDSGETAAAERALDRAQRLLDTGNEIAALGYLHRARAGFFNGDARPRMVELTLATAAAYNDLGLHAAGKYFSLVAAELADPQDAHQHAQGLAYAAVADFHQGHWISATYFACRALLVHQLLDEQALDFDQHPWLSNAFYELTHTRSLAAKLGTPYQDFVHQKITAIGAGDFLDELERDALDGKPAWWDELGTDAHVARVLDELGRPPFADATEHRYIRFPCLGVTWTVVFRNLYADTAAGERYAAALQVTLAHLVRHDPAFLPTKVTVYITAVDNGQAVEVEAKRSNPGESVLSVLLPQVGTPEEEHYNEVARETIGAVTAAVVLPSTRNDEQFRHMLKATAEEGVLSVVLFGMPYDAAWRAAVTEAEFATWPDSAAAATSETATPDAHPALALPTTPGPGYTQEHSLGEVRHRYADLPPRMAPTLGALREDPAFKETVAALRAEGWSDWQLLLAVHNIAKNARLAWTTEDTNVEPKVLTQKFMAPEPPGEPMPTELFTVDAHHDALRNTVGSSAMTWWHLTLRQEPLDGEAVLALLRTRYGWLTDDVEHADPFAQDAPGDTG